MHIYSIMQCLANIIGAARAALQPHDSSPLQQNIPDAKTTVVLKLHVL